jgi:hypothetical protein
LPSLILFLSLYPTSRVDTLLAIASGSPKAGVMSSLGCEDVRAAVRTYINQVSTVDILVNFTWMVPILECFYRRTVILLMSFLSVFCAFRHFPRSSTSSEENAGIVAYVPYLQSKANGTSRVTIDDGTREISSRTSASIQSRRFIPPGCANSTIPDRREQRFDRGAHACVPDLTLEVFDTRSTATYAVSC